MDLNSPITFFVGNLENTLPDSFILSILQQIGKVTRWKRAKDATDRTIDFGFADFANPKDALRVLRIAPSIKVMNKTWIIRTDKRVEADLEAYQSSLSLDPTFNHQNEFREDQKILKIINDQIKSATFAKSGQRLQGVIVSEFDEARETEHFRYLAEIRKENEDFELLFKEKLLKQKAIEVNRETERKEFDSLKAETKERKERKEFLMNWEPPTIESLNDDNSLIEFTKQWTAFESIRNERIAIRQREKEIEKRIPLG